MTPQNTPNSFSSLTATVNCLYHCLLGRQIQMMKEYKSYVTYVFAWAGAL